MPSSRIAHCPGASTLSRQLSLRNALFAFSGCSCGLRRVHGSYFKAGSLLPKRPGSAFHSAAPFVLLPGSAAQSVSLTLMQPPSSTTIVAPEALKRA